MLVMGRGRRGKLNHYYYMRKKRVKKEALAK